MGPYGTIFRCFWPVFRKFFSRLEVNFSRKLTSLDFSDMPNVNQHHKGLFWPFYDCFWTFLRHFLIILLLFLDLFWNVFLNIFLFFFGNIWRFPDPFTTWQELDLKCPSLKSNLDLNLSSLKSDLDLELPSLKSELDLTCQVLYQTCIRLAKS